MSKEIEMGIGSVLDNLDKPVPYFTHTIYKLLTSTKYNQPLKLTTLEHQGILTSLKDNFDLSSESLSLFVKDTVSVFDPDNATLIILLGPGRVENKELIFDHFNYRYAVACADTMPIEKESSIVVRWDINKDNMTAFLIMEHQVNTLKRIYTVG